MSEIYTGSREGDALVSNHLNIIREALLQSLPMVEALILIGSFGRGEGIVIERNGVVKPLNDYDIAVVTEQPLSYLGRLKLKRLRHKLAQELGVWHIDLIPFISRDLESARCRMILYDMKFGSAVFYGDPRIIDRIPFAAAEGLPDAEIENLLINRMVTFVEGHPELNLVESFPHAARQLAKVIYALTDSVLNLHGRYVTHYRRKEESLRALGGTSAEVDELCTMIDWAQDAFQFRLPEEQLRIHPLRKIWSQVRRLFLMNLLMTASRAHHQSYRTVDDLFGHWRSVDARDGVVLQVFRRFFGRTDKRLSEKRLLALILSYPESRKFPELQVSIPSAEDASGSIRSEWKVVAKDLVASWYKA